ncbi:MAG: hypothetical protein IBX44_06225 [Sulfurospirillum sp.]|nr:hypothetical protein [Sulfurospirillum sp.]
MRDLELKNILKIGAKEFLVSTISMHVRHSFFDGDNAKIVYETMVFEIVDGDVAYHKTIFNERYNMKEEAIAEHGAILKNPEAFFIV